MTTAFSDLPAEALSSILCEFCDGKTISTMLSVCLGNSAQLRHIAIDLCRGVLVQRLVTLSTQLKQEPEVRDVVDVMREEIRLSPDEGIDSLTQLSHGCAALDYFEVHFRVAESFSLKMRQWVVWSGRITLIYGEISAFMVTNDWSAGALQYWRSTELASGLNLTRPRNRTGFAFTSDRIPYATLLSADTAGQLRITRQATDLHIESYIENDRLDDTRHTLIPQDQAYDGNPDVVFCDHSFVSRRQQEIPVGPLLIGSQADTSLCCCWDKDLGEDDWEHAVSKLGEHVVHIMKSFGGSFEEALKVHFARVNEFSNELR